MSTSDKLEFHFIDLKGDVTGDGNKPAVAGDHHSLSISRSSINKLIATRESANTGDPLPATRAAVLEEAPTRVTPPSPIDSRALGVDFSMVPAVAAESTASEAAPAIDTVAETGANELVPPEATQSESHHAEPPLLVAIESETEPRKEAESVPQIEAEDLRNFSSEIVAQVPSERADAETSLQRDLPAAERPTKEPQVQTQPDPESTIALSLGSEADSVLGDVQQTLDSLADMAKGLTQQKLDALKQHESLEQRRTQLQEKERLLADKDEQLRLLEARLTREVSNLERNAEDNARALAERSAALKALAESVEARDRNTAKLADSLRLEKQRNDELTESLLRRAATLDEREATLNRKDDELAEKLKQLIAAKDRFRSLVKAFNETVQFNDTLNAISITALDDNQQ